MNICIGGPWHGSKLLGNVSHEKFFKIKGSTSNSITTYFKKIVKFKNEKYVFWVSDELLDMQADEIIRGYLVKKFHTSI